MILTVCFVGVSLPVVALCVVAEVIVCMFVHLCVLQIFSLSKSCVLSTGKQQKVCGQINAQPEFVDTSLRGIPTIPIAAQNCSE